jgi:hypothetical protein
MHATDIASIRSEGIAQKERHAKKERKKERKKNNFIMDIPL